MTGILAILFFQMASKRAKCDPNGVKKAIFRKIGLRRLVAPPSDHDQNTFELHEFIQHTAKIRQFSDIKF